jgi:tellurite resistance protein TehA-like permease
VDIALWVLQIVGGVLFVASAYAHGLAYERSKLRMVWLAALPTWSVPFIALVELAGGIGLVLPAATRIASWLTPLAALLLAILMALAIAFHLARREYRNIALNAVLGILAAIVAYGRYVVAPLS